ncbi:MAG: M64 family metallopeptidase [Bacteroidota bacterium]
MKKILLLIAVQFVALHFLKAQTFEIDTLQYKGSTDKYINLVIMGDGYTAAEQDTFVEDARNSSDHLLSQIPWSNYKNYFNVFAIKVISAESGTKHPNTADDCNASVPASNPETYFGCTFDYYGIHRLVVPVNTSNIASVLANNFPNYDQVIILANTPYYGGSGGEFATSTTDQASNEVTAHEIGHSFAKLADEYYAGDSYARESANMTQETGPGLVKWKNWMDYEGIGIYPHFGGGNASQWYKPHENCKMQSLGSPFCSVCAETIVKTIHSLASPLVSFTPVNSAINTADNFIDFKLTELIRPTPDNLKIEWRLDNTIIAMNTDSLKIDQSKLSGGIHSLTASVIDTTPLIRDESHTLAYISTVSWTISTMASGIEVTSAVHKVSCSIFPNPSSNTLNIAIESDKESTLSIQVISLEGKVVRQIDNEMLVNGKYSNTIDIENLANGAYTIVFKIDGLTHTQHFVKQ